MCLQSFISAGEQRAQLLYLLVLFVVVGGVRRRRCLVLVTHIYHELLHVTLPTFNE